MDARSHLTHFGKPKVGDRLKQQFAMAATDALLYIDCWVPRWLGVGLTFVMVFAFPPFLECVVNNACNPNVSEQGLLFLVKFHRGLNICIPSLSLLPLSLPSSVSSFFPL